MRLRIIEALDAYFREVEKELADDNTATIGKQFEEIKRSRADMTFADVEQIETARDRYCLGSSDNIEVDDGALTSQADDGTSVNAWVWLPKEES
jgi:hypothetical protein